MGYSQNNGSTHNLYPNMNINAVTRPFACEQCGHIIWGRAASYRKVYDYIDNTYPYILKYGDIQKAMGMHRENVRLILNHLVIIGVIFKPKKGLYEVRRS